MSYARLAQRLYNTALLITADKLDVLDHVLRAYDEGRAKLLSPYDKKERPELALNGAPQITQSGYVRTAQGVAIIPIMGTLVQRTGGMDAESGLTSYAAIGAQLSAAIADPQTRGILLEVDSDGGEASGVFDLAAEIRAAATSKPIFAHANERAFSAAYALASGAEAIYTPRIGMVGSIGARMRHVDQSQYDAKRGFVYTDIVSGDRKADMSPNSPLSDSARAFMQDHVDRLGGIFAAMVADMRGVDEQSVRDTQAGLLHSDEAMAAGLIDGVATINETMQMLLDRIGNSQNSTYGMRAHGRASPARAHAATLSTGDENMLTETEKAAHAAAIAEARATALAEGRASAKAESDAENAKKLTEAQTTAATAAQVRVLAILGHAEAEGRSELAKKLAASALSVEQCVELLAAAPKQAAAQTNALATAMNKVPNPKVGADGQPVDGDGKAKAARPGLDPANVIAFRRECVANARAGKPAPQFPVAK